MSTANACVPHGNLDCAECYPDLRRRQRARIEAHVPVPAEYDAYLRAGFAEMQRALDEGRKVWGWQYGARVPVSSVEMAPPNDDGWAYLGKTGGGFPFHFTTPEIEGSDISSDPAEDAALRWLEGIAYGPSPRSERNNALRLLCMLPKRSRHA